MNKKVFFTLFALLSNMTATMAAETDLMELSLEDLMEVEIITASKQHENVSDTPSTVIVITQQQIQHRRYLNLLDLLRDLAGMDIQRMNEETAFHNLTWRGNFGNNKFLILQDGIRIDSPAGELIPVDHNFPLYHAKQVEILYGPAAALYGADAFGGVINIITEKGENIGSATLSSAIGSDDYRYHYVHAGSKLNEQWSFAIGGHKHDADTADLSKDYDEYAKVDAVTFGGETVVAAADRENYVATQSSNSAFARLDFDKHFSVGFNHSFFRHLSSTGVKPSTAIFEEEAQWNTRIDTIYGKYRFDLTDKLSGETTVNYSRYELLPQSKFKNIFVDFRDGYKYSKGKRTGIEQQFNYQVNDSHTAIAGISYESFSSLPKTADLTSPFNRDKTFNEQGLFYIGTDNTLPIDFPHTDYSNSALYLQLKSAWNEKLSSVIGMRYDKNSRYDSTVNPRLGLVYKFRPTTIFKANYGEAFRAPTVKENLEHYGSFNGQKNDNGEYISYFFHAPNVDLEPEKMRSVELNLTHIFDENLSFSASAYYSQVDNLIMSRSTETPIQFIKGGEILSTAIFDNLGKGEQYGLDLTMNYQRKLGAGFSSNLWGSYSYIDGSVRNSLDNIDVDLPYIAQHKFKLGATLSYQNKYFVTPTLYAIDRTNSKRIDSNNPTERLQSPGYVIMDLHLGAVDIFDNLSANLDIYNLFDTHYYNTGGISSVTFLGVPQQPRSFVFSLSLKF